MVNKHSFSIPVHGARDCRFTTQIRNPHEKRSAQATIDLVLHENQVLSGDSLFLAVLSILSGLTVLGVALWRNQPGTAVAGVAETYLFIPAWRFVQKLRRENIMIRLLQVGLNNAQTTSEAVDKIRAAFEEQLRWEEKTPRDEGDSPRE
jgi:polyribonucleotide nucleotidyltransferase